MKQLAFALVAVLAIFAAAPAAGAQGFVVVVNAENPASSMSRSDVANAFLKRGTRLVAVDLERNSPVREAFSQAIHGRGAAAIVSHWQQQIFAGRDVPPAERGSDADVLAFVRGNANAIGYVAAGTALGSGVKALTVN